MSILKALVLYYVNAHPGASPRSLIGYFKTIGEEMGSTRLGEILIGLQEDGLICKLRRGQYCVASTAIAHVEKVLGEVLRLRAAGSSGACATNGNVKGNVKPPAEAARPRAAADAGGDRQHMPTARGSDPQLQARQVLDRLYRYFGSWQQAEEFARAFNCESFEIPPTQHLEPAIARRRIERSLHRDPSPASRTHLTNFHGFDLRSIVKRFQANSERQRRTATPCRHPRLGRNVLLRWIV